MKQFHFKYIFVVLYICISNFLNAQSFSTSSTNVTCNGGTDGTITMTVTGSSSQYTYKVYDWYPPYDIIAQFGPTSDLSHTFTNLSAMEYIVWYYDEDLGSYEFWSYVNMTEPDVLNATVTKTNIVCNGADNGTITFSNPTGGYGTYEYFITGESWQSGTDFTGLAPAAYTTIIRDAAYPTCEVNLGVQNITELAVLNATVSSTNVTCNGANNGTITIDNPSGGSGSFEYSINDGVSWQSGAVPLVYSGLSPDTYEVKIRDAVNTSCEVYLDPALVITEPGVLTGQIDVIKGLTCSDGNDGILFANISGGTPPYTFDWEYNVGAGWISLGEFNQTLNNNVSQAQYRCIVDDDNGCGPITPGILFYPGFLPADTIPTTIPAITDTAVVNECAGQLDGSITISSMGGVTPYTYSINTGGGSGYQPSNVFNGLAGNTYETWIKDAKGCTKQGPDAIVGVDAIVPVSVTISANPVGAICPGDNVEFTAVPTGGGSLPSYQWKVNGFDVGSDSDTYNTTGLNDADQVIVELTSSEKCPSVIPAISNIINMSVLSQPNITVQPVGGTQCEGTDFTFSVTATGDGITYQWYKDGSPITDSTRSELALTGLTQTEEGDYTVQVSGTCTPSVTSNIATLIVDAPPVITVDPVSATRCEGEDYTLSVTATGDGLTYQWYKNAAVITDSTRSELALTGLDQTDEASYHVEVTGNCGGPLASAAAILTVDEPIAITVQPVGGTQCEGTDKTFTVTVTGDNPTYQWYKDGSPITDSIRSELILTGLAQGDEGDYQVQVSGTCTPLISSNTVTLTVDAATQITLQPTSSLVCDSSAASFNVSATGSGALTYQWQYLNSGSWRDTTDGTNYNGTGTSTFSIDTVTDADTGRFRCIVTGLCGIATTDTVTLSINHMAVSVGKPTPFLIDTATTEINVSVTIVNRIVRNDLDIVLVAPDSSEIMLKMNQGICEFSPDRAFIVTFSNLNTNSMDICTAPDTITGTYGADGSWGALHNQDPANGEWKIRLYDHFSFGASIDGYLKQASISFYDTNFNNNPETVKYNSGSINIGITNQQGSGGTPTDYAVPIGLQSSCAGLVDARAIVTVAGGISPFSYAWSSIPPVVIPDTNSYDLGAGTYTVVVTDNIGCTGSTTVEVTEPPKLVIDTMNFTDTLKCFGDSDGEIHVKASGGTGTLTYLLHPGNIPSEEVDSGAWTGLFAGTDTVEITDVNGCLVDSIVTIIQPDSLYIANINVTPIYCYGDTNGIIDATPSGGTQPYTFTLEEVDLAVILETNSTGLFDSLASGRYKVKLTGANACRIDSSNIITINDPPPALTFDTIVSPIAVCATDGVTLTVVANGGQPPYDIRLDDGGTPIVLNVLDTARFTSVTKGSYDIEITDFNGCSIDSIGYIVVGPASPIIPSISTTDVTCPNDADGEILINNVTGGWGNYSYSFEGGSFGADTNFTGLYQGSYTIRIRDSLNVSVRCTREFEIPISGPYLYDSIDSMNIVGTEPGWISIKPFGSNPPFSYWVNDTLFDPLERTYTLFNDTIDTVFVSDTGWYYIDIKDINGCTYLDSIRILSENLNVEFEITEITCPGDYNGSIMVKILNGIKPFTISYNGLPPEILDYPAPVPFFFPVGLGLDANTYIIHIEDSIGRPYDTTITLTDPDPIVFSTIETQPTCQNEKIDGELSEDGVIDASNATGGSGDLTFSLYSYFVSDTLLLETNDHGVFAGYGTGLYQTFVFDTNNCAVSDIDTLIGIGRFETSNWSWINDTVCYLSEVQLHAYDNRDGLNYTWFPDSLFGALGNQADSNPSFVINQPVDISLIVDDGVCRDSLYRSYKLYDTIGMFITTDQLVVGKDSIIGEIGKSFNVDLPEEYAYSFMLYNIDNWPNAADTLVPVINSTFLITVQEDLPYLAIGITGDGCAEYDTFYVRLKKEINIYTVFTPNNDGVNDFWKIPFAEQYPNIEVEIYNRWGQQVYYRKGYGEEKGDAVWDGKSSRNNKDLPVGTYLYIIKPNDKETSPITGTVTIIR